MAMRNGVAADIVPAPLARRAGAWVIDWLALLLINFGIAGLLGASEDEQQAVLLSLVVFSLYHIVSLSVRSGTPGKTMLGLSVTDLQGHALKPDAAILRSLVYLVGVLVFFLGVLASLYLVATDRRYQRALHDRVAGTIVVVGRPRDR